MVGKKLKKNNTKIIKKYLFKNYLLINFNFKTKR